MSQFAQTTVQWLAAGAVGLCLVGFVLQGLIYLGGSVRVHLLGKSRDFGVRVLDARGLYYRTHALPEYLMFIGFGLLLVIAVTGGLVWALAFIIDALRGAVS